MPVATLLPLAEQQFCDENGVPYAGGSVFFYIPNTTTPKLTWQDAAETTPNTNPVILDSAGRAIIYGSGQYRQILQDADGNVVWDQLVQDVYSLINQGISIWGGTAGGTADAITLTATPSISTLTDGLLVAFIASANNTGPVTVNVSGLGVTPVKIITSTGTAALVANNIVDGGRYLFLYDGVDFILLNPTTPAVSDAFTNIASATTTDLGSVGSNNINVTGTSTITSFGSSAVVTNPVYLVTFSGSLQITQSANIVTPNSRNIQTQAGDFAILQYTGTGTWAFLNYFPAVGYIGSINPISVTSSETYFPSTNLVYCLIEMVGGGGGGAGCGSGGATGSGGGGAGGYLRALLTAAQVGASQGITVNSGGAGGGSGINAGTGGGSVTFGSLLSCNGGNGGSPHSTPGTTGSGSGGAGGNPTITTGSPITSSAGQTGSTGGANNICFGGAGGSSPLGGGGGGTGVNDTTNPGINATGFGAGGSGASSGTSGAAGGNGSPAVVIITEYLYK